TLTESTPIRPRTRYAAAKHALHVLLDSQSSKGAFSVAWLRLFYLYGPHEHAARLVPTVIRALLDGHAVPVTSGTQVRDFLHVEDVAEAFWAALRSDVTGALNVGSGRAVTVREVVETIGRITGRPKL